VGSNPTPPTTDGRVVMMKAIFVWKVPSGQSEEFVRRWKARSEVFQTYVGARGTKLFRSSTDPNIFAAIASWESSETRKEASEAKDRDYPHLKNLEKAELMYSGTFVEIEAVNPRNR
jgi:heme-degrading monooxygenase HmoA